MIIDWYLDFIIGILSLTIFISIVTFIYHVGHKLGQRKLEDNSDNTYIDNAKEQNRYYR